MKKTILYIFVIVIGFFSCKKDKNTVSPFTGFSYAPVNAGHSVIYEVDSIIKDDFTQKSDTFKFQIKEVIESIFSDNAGRPTLRLERYKRQSASEPWVIYKIWTANRTGNNLEKKEDNITYVKLIFPPVAGNSWEGNSLNALTKENYKYTAVNEPATQNNLYFDSTLTVLQQDYEDLLSKQFAVEKYAAGVGMIYKEQDSIKFDYLTQTITSRKLYKETLISFSN